MTSSMKLGELNWTDVRKITRNVVVVLPLGALEQHSYHLPVLTDSLIVTAIAERLEEGRSDRVLLLPTLWIGASEDHMMFAGSIDCGLKLHVDLIVEAASSLALHGFSTFLMLNGHGGNAETIQTSNRILKERFPQATFASANYWQVADSEINAILETQRGLGHACELETSILLLTHPELVRMNQMEPDGIRLSADLRGVRVARTFDERTEHGGFGNPQSGTAEKGERLLTVITRRLSEVVDAL